jgi:hypothetical protein
MPDSGLYAQPNITTSSVSAAKQCIYVVVDKLALAALRLLVTMLHALHGVGSYSATILSEAQPCSLLDFPSKFSSAQFSTRKCRQSGQAY